MAAMTKAAFLKRQYFKGRNKKQAEADWNRMKGRKSNPKPKRKATKPRKSGSPAKRKASAPKKKSNPAGAVPVLLMNPSGGKSMAKRRRRKTTKRKTTKRRRRRNPAKKWDPAGVALAAVGGGAVAGGTFLLDGTDLKIDHQNIGVLIGSAVLGVGLSKWAPNLAKGIAGAGLGIGTLGLLRTHVMPPFGEKQVTREKTETTDAVRARLGKAGRKTHALMMNAVRAQLGCQRSYGCEKCNDLPRCEMRKYLDMRGLPQARSGADMGAVRAPLPRAEWSSAMPGMV